MNLRRAAVLTGLARGLAANEISETGPFSFDRDTPAGTPSGMSSYATGGDTAGKWLVREMPDALSGGNLIVQTDADATDMRFPVPVAASDEYANVAVTARALSGKGGQGIGLVLRSRNPLIDAHEMTYSIGKIGLWTKGGVLGFDDLTAKTQ